MRFLFRYSQGGQDHRLAFGNGMDPVEVSLGLEEIHSRGVT
jgi:hypothetical protein